MNKYNYDIFKINIDEELKAKLNKTLIINTKTEAINYIRTNNIITSTMTIYGSLGTKINCPNVAYYISMHENSIVCVNAAPVGMRGFRCLDVFKIKKKQTKKKDVFYNQVPLYIQPDPVAGVKHNPINIKLFQNGTVHLTGCQHMCSVYNVLGKLINELKNPKEKLISTGEYEEIHFVDKVSELKLSDLYVALINTTFYVDYLIGRDKLYYLLCMNNIICKNNQGHASIDIKYYYEPDNLKISIFVFKSCVIITGAKHMNHIIAAYDYITKILKHYHTEISLPIVSFKKVKSIVQKKYPHVNL